MNPSTLITREATIGGQARPKPGRRLVLESKLFTDVDQAVPVRVIWGTDRVAGVHIFPVFDFGSEEISEEAGK